MKHFLSICCILAIFVLVDVESGRVKRGGCYCINGAGTYCGSTKRIQQISGDCSEHDLYFCPSGRFALARWEGKCARGCYAATNGRDYCK